MRGGFRWWWPTPVWLCVTGEELVLLAVSRRRFAESAPLEMCLSSHYCYATGEFVIEPVEGLTVSRLRVTPREALALMEVMGISGVEASEDSSEDESEE